MTKLAGDNVRVLVAGYELTGDSNRVVVNDQRDMYDVTSFASEVHKFIGGKRNANLDHSGYLNAVAAASHPVLKGATVNGVVSVLLGQNADPTVGDPVYSLPVRQGRYASSVAVGNYIPFAALFANKGELGGWGVSLAPPTTFTDSTNGTAVDNGAATNAGGAAFLHVLEAAASDAYTLTLEGSDTGAFGGEESVLGTFTADASALTSERLVIPSTTTIPRYVRWKAVRTGSAGDSVTIAVSLIRF